MKKFLSILLCLCMLTALAPMAIAEEAPKAQPETKIVLSDDGIIVNGKAITEDTSADVYLEKRNEQHKDVADDLKDVVNDVVVVAASGSYRFSGSVYDGQIAVRAGEEDSVRIILDGVTITNRTAPAIQVYTAKQTYDEGQYFATIELADGSENLLTGSHTKKKDPLEEDQTAKHDGAISSNVSLGFEGTGKLELHADCEGIEVKFGHMTINGGVYHIYASDDPVNCSEDGIAVLTINDGYFACSVDPLTGFEGDGIDSNGYIKIYGGTLITRAHPTSMDGGVDSDLGSFINGGTVVAAGNMYDAIEDNSEQLFMMLEFEDETDELIVVTNDKDEPIFAYDFPYTYTYILFSLPNLTEGTYHVWIGGKIEGKEQDGLYTEITSYTDGEQMRHGGSSDSFGGSMPGGGMPDGGAPQGADPHSPPQNFTPPQGGGTPPQGGPGGMGMTDNDEASYDFVLPKDSRTFTNVTSISMAAAMIHFSDIEKDAWYYESVMDAAGLGLIDGIGNNKFDPNGNMTYAQAIKLAACMNEMFTTADITLENGTDVWYSTYVKYCLEKGIITEEPKDYNAYITRTEYAALFANALPEKGYDDINDIEDDSIPDVKMDDPNAEAIYKLYSAGILTGSDDGCFKPNDNIRRCEVATVIVRMMVTGERVTIEEE